MAWAPHELPYLRRSDSDKTAYGIRRAIYLRSRSSADPILRAYLRRRSLLTSLSYSHIACSKCESVSPNLRLL